MTVLGWLATAAGAVWAVVLVIAKADLEDPDVSRWVARKLIYRAALRLPRGERARWREEAISNILDLPGRLPPLWWALDTWMRSGRWGRARGAPSRREVLAARARAAWQWLRSLPEGRARALSKQLHPSRLRVPAEPTPAKTVAFDAVLVNPLTITGGGSVEVKLPNSPWRPSSWAATRPPVSDDDFEAWLAQERRDFDDHVDRKAEEYRRARDRELGL